MIFEQYHVSSRFRNLKCSVTDAYIYNILFTECLITHSCYINTDTFTILYFPLTDKWFTIISNSQLFLTRSFLTRPFLTRPFLIRSLLSRSILTRSYLARLYLTRLFITQSLKKLLLLDLL